MSGHERSSGLVISGHRELLPEDVLVVQREVELFLGFDDFDTWVFGGARGVDTLALAHVLQLRGVASRPRLLVVVPNTVTQQPTETRAVTLQADLVVELRHPITREDNFWALHHRNEFMIDWVAPEGHLLAFWNGQPSGTRNAIQYAQSQHVEISRRSIKRK